MLDYKWREQAGAKEEGGEVAEAREEEREAREEE
jgi:hypothetical protein